MVNAVRDKLHFAVTRCLQESENLLEFCKFFYKNFLMDQYFQEADTVPTESVPTDDIPTDSVPTDAIPTIHSQNDPVHL